MTKSLLQNITDPQFWLIVADFLEDRGNPVSDYIRAVISLHSQFPQDTNNLPDEAPLAQLGELRERAREAMQQQGIGFESFSGESVTYKGQRYNIGPNGRISRWDAPGYRRGGWTPVRPDKVPPLALEALLFSLVGKLHAEAHAGGNWQEKLLRQQLYDWMEGIINMIGYDEINIAIRGLVRGLAKRRQQYEGASPKFKAEVNERINDFARRIDQSGIEIGNEAVAHRLQQVIALLRRLFKV